MFKVTVRVRHVTSARDILQFKKQMWLCYIFELKLRYCTEETMDYEKLVLLAFVQMIQHERTGYRDLTVTTQFTISPSR